LTQTIIPKEKLGQLFITGIDGLNINADTIHFLQTYQPGGVYVTADNMKNPKQVHHLTNGLQQHAGRQLPLFIAVKYRGGAYHPLEKQLTPNFSQQALGTINNRLYTRQMAEITAKELSGMGININLAPVLNPGTEEIHFSNHLYNIAKHGRAVIEGHQLENVLATPGSFSLEDIDTKLPIYKTMLHPFDYGIRHGAEAILTADATNTGAFLRDKWQFDGLIIQDYSEKEADVASVISSLKNGADIILLHDSYKKQMDIMDAVQEAVKNEEIPQHLIQDAIRRIKKSKQEYQVGRLTPFNRELFRAHYSMFRAGIIRELVK
jgi:beta-N-acetylhexosaminidase